MSDSTRSTPADGLAAREEYEARMVAGGMPTDCCDYGVISVSRGVEVCRVWREDDARKIADLLNDRILASLQPAPAPFQERVAGWMLECFTPEIAADKLERADRFCEEALELVQTTEGFSAERAHALVDYVFSRPEGDPVQEVGGVMVTLAALCGPNGLDMIAAGEAEYERINKPEIIEKIRAKQASKPVGSALPIAAPAPETAELRERLEFPEGAIENGRVLIDRLENHYLFADEHNHGLAKCWDWEQLQRCFEHLAEYAGKAAEALASLEAERRGATERAAQIVERHPAAIGVSKTLAQAIREQQ